LTHQIKTDIGLPSAVKQSINYRLLRLKIKV
jgi:hypothetical protein